jgi:phage gpG-like protein
MKPEEVRNFLTQQIAAIKRKALDIIAVEAQKSVKKNFEAGGRPKWKPSKKLRKHPGAKTLIVTGNLSNVSAVVSEAESSVTLTTNPLSRAYARIQQEGGTINHPAREMKFRRNKTGRTVFASSNHKRITKTTTSKPYTITIPARPYMIIPKADLDAMIEKIKKGIGQ